MIDNNVFLNGILEQINNIVTNDQLKQIKVKLSAYVDDYTIEQKNRAVAVRDSQPQAYKHFLVSKKIEGLSDKTIESYKQYLDMFFNAVTYPITEITTQTVQVYLFNYSKEIHNGMDHVPSSHTMNQYQTILNCFFTWCVNNGYITNNPCSSLGKIKYQKKDIDVLTEKQLQDMLQATNTEFDTVVEQRRANAILNVFISTGIRVSELVNIKLANIKWNAPINNTIPLIIECGKGNKDRTVFLTDVAAISVLDYMQVRNSDSEYLFVRTTNGNGQLSTRTVQNIVSTLGNIIGVETCHPHMIRHSVATEMAKKGTSINILQKMLGHSNSNVTTKYYVKSEEEQIAKEVNEKLC